MGSLTRPLYSGPPKGGRSTQEIQLVEARVLLLLFTDVFPDHRFVSPYGRDEVPSCPEMLAHKIALPLAIDAGQVDRALLPLMKPITCETAYFGGIEIIM